MAKRRGRPKGSKNRDYETVDQIPAQCTRCFSMKLRIVDGNKPIVREIAGTLPDGTEYDSVRWDRKQCTECQQLIAVRTFFQKLKSTVD